MRQLLERHPVVGVIGARQVEKTTLVRRLASALSIPQANTFDLENPRHLSRLSDTLLALESLRGLVVIDEIQRRSEPLRQGSASLAGRIHYQHPRPDSPTALSPPGTGGRAR